MGDDSDEQLEQRVDQLEQQLSKMLPGRRGVLKGLGAAALGGAAVGASSGGAAGQSAAGQIGTSSEPVDVKAASVGAQSVNTVHNHPDERQSDVIIWQDGSTIYADGQNGTISSGDKSTGTTAVILDAIQSVANNNGTLRLAPGEYVAEEPIATSQRPIDGSDGFEIIGSGKESTIIKSSGDFGTNSSLFVVGDYPDSPYPEYQNVRVSGITFDHTAQTSSGADVLVFNVNVNDSIVENCRFEGGTLYQTDISDCSNVTVRNNVYLNAPDGTAAIYLFHALTDQNWRDTHQVYGNYINQATRGVAIDGAQDSWVYSNYFEGTVNQAIFATTTPDFNPDSIRALYNVIVNHDGAEAIHMEGNHSITAFNLIRDCTGRGVLILGDTADKTDLPTSDNKVFANNIIEHDGWGVRLQASKNSTVSMNAIRSTKTGSQGVQALSFETVTSTENDILNNGVVVEGAEYDLQDPKNTINGSATESASAETPQIDWPIGTVIDFTDSGDGSGTAVYVRLPDGSYSEIGT